MIIGSKGIMVRGGFGGDGLVSFRHEKYIPFGGPDGGDGGVGGDVFIMAEPRADDLGVLRQKKEFIAENGNQGGSGQKHGKKGEALIILVPLGTMIFVEGSEPFVPFADLTTPGRKVLVAKGGRGGLGNTRFATAVNQAPEIASKGEPGEERHIILEFKLITDICIIGYPNSGKSTSLAAISRARPQIADYPFTTRQPILGVLSQSLKRDFVIAEIPGIVEGAHSGKGLGNEFLRHVERTKLLIYLVDGTSPTIADDLRKLDKELELYKPGLPQKPKIVAVNKVDLPQVQARLSDIKQALNKLEVPIFYISAVSGLGLMELTRKAMEMVEQAQDEEVSVGEGLAPPPTFMVFHPRPKGMLNPKHEIRNAKQYRSTNDQNLSSNEVKDSKQGKF